MDSFRHVTDFWDAGAEAACGEDALALLLYRSNLLGRDLRITNFGGGNTSCRRMERDPLTGESAEVMWIKGSGGDLGTLSRKGVAGLYTAKIRALKKNYQGKATEDALVPLLQYCLFDPNSAAPSIDTPLHGLLPFAHIDHLHPDAIIALAAARDGEAIVRELWGKQMGWIPWQRPGFDLAIQLEDCLEKNPDLIGIILGSHGLFTWGETSRACYYQSLAIIEKAALYLEEISRSKGPAFGGAALPVPGTATRRKQAAAIMPLLRGLCGGEKGSIAHFSDSPELLTFLASKDLERLAPMGTSCPDHFLRTKIRPLLLPLSPEDDLQDYPQLHAKLSPVFESYREDYAAYYQACRRPESPPMRDANPVVVLYPGIGQFTFARDKQTARVSAEFYQNAVNVMRGAETISAYTALPRQEAFDIEYWQLEEAKWQRMPPEKPLSRKVALITGGGGGIGSAIAKRLLDAGAQVVITDRYADRIEDVCQALNSENAIGFQADITKAEDLDALLAFTCLSFGGVDILVHSAGLALSRSLADTQESDWDLLQEVLVKAQFQLYRKAAAIMVKQGNGGNLIAIASKNGLVAGPDNVAYGTAKAAQQHMSRLLAAELARHGIRVNTVNPDGVITGSKIWQGAWAEGRAKTYGISVEELPDHYARRNLLGQKILPEDIAHAVYAILAILTKSTGLNLNVDGGISEAFVR